LIDPKFVDFGLRIIVLIVGCIVVAHVFKLIFKFVRGIGSDKNTLIFTLEIFMTLLVGYVCLDMFVLHKVIQQSAESFISFLILLTFVTATIISTLICSKAIKRSRR
jgi:hypothetical protein